MDFSQVCFAYCVRALTYDFDGVQAQLAGFYQAVGFLCLDMDVRTLDFTDTNLIDRAHQLGRQAASGNVRGCQFHWLQSVERIVARCFVSGSLRADAFLRRIRELENAWSYPQLRAAADQLLSEFGEDRRIAHWLQFWLKHDVVVHCI